jgi:hypothetical protein
VVVRGNVWQCVVMRGNVWRCYVLVIRSPRQKGCHAAAAAAAAAAGLLPGPWSLVSGSGSVPGSWQPPCRTGFASNHQVEDQSAAASEEQACVIRPITVRSYVYGLPQVLNRSRQRGCSG